MKNVRFNAAEALGFTRLTEVQDSEVWTHLLTPQMRAQLGKITQYGEPRVMESITGHFPGDEATNLNGHQLFGSTNNVRFPYVSTLHKTEHGVLVIKRDGVKLKVTGWVGDVLGGKGELIYIGALRDRRFDGTKRANDSALLQWTYDDPQFHKVLHPELRSLEISVYSFSPGSRIGPTSGDYELEAFVEKPFTFLDRPEIFRRNFEKAWLTQRSPGQFAAPMHDVAKVVLPGFERIAARKGYDVVESAVSHYHVAWWFKSRGYSYSYLQDEQTMQQFAAGIKAILRSGQKLTRQQESWVAVVQSLRPVELIPDGLFLNGPLWPQDNVGPQLLLMHKPLSEKATRLLAERQSQ